MPAQIVPRLMDINQTAEYLSISPKTIRNGIYRDSPNPFPVRPRRLGKRVLFDRKDLDEFIDNLHTE